MADARREAFVEPVVAERMIEEEVKIFSAPVGTAIPDAGEAFPAGWKVGLPVIMDGVETGLSEDRPKD